MTSLNAISCYDFMFHDFKRLVGGWLFDWADWVLLVLMLNCESRLTQFFRDVRFFPHYKNYRANSNYCFSSSEKGNMLNTENLSSYILCVHISGMSVWVFIYNSLYNSFSNIQLNRNKWKYPVYSISFSLLSLLLCIYLSSWMKIIDKS